MEKHGTSRNSGNIKKRFALIVAPAIMILLLFVPVSTATSLAEARQMEKIVFVDYGKKVHTNSSHSIDLCGDGTNKYTLLGGKVRWQEFPVPYYVNTSGFASDSVSAEEAVAAVVAAFDTWDEVDRPNDQTFEQVLNSDDAKITVSWQPVDGSFNILGSTAVIYIADTKEILSSQIIFDSDELWFIGNESDVCENVGLGFDIQNIVTHEIGHAVGLGHVNDPALTMYPYASPGETLKRSLGQGDRSGFNRVQ